VLFAVCVFVQGAKSGGGVSAPIAQRILEQSLALEKGFDPGLAWIEPARGSFAPIDEVNYKTGPVIGGEADRETAEHHTEPAAKNPKKKAAPEATPDIKPDADERGSVSKKTPVDEAREKRSFFEKLFGPRKTDPTPVTPLSPAGKLPR
jgi:hypothetical protein